MSKQVTPQQAEERQLPRPAVRLPSLPTLRPIRPLNFRMPELPRLRIPTLPSLRSAQIFHIQFEYETLCRLSIIYSRRPTFPQLRNPFRPSRVPQPRPAPQSPRPAPQSAPAAAPAAPVPAPLAPVFEPSAPATRAPAPASRPPPRATRPPSRATRPPPRATRRPAPAAPRPTQQSAPLTDPRPAAPSDFGNAFSSDPFSEFQNGE